RSPGGDHGGSLARVPPELSVPPSTVRPVGDQHGSAILTETGTAPASARRSAGGSGATEPRRCGWCRRVLPEQGSVGRKRQYCGQPCRQRAYEQRTTTARAGLSGDVVVVTRAELDGLQDRLYQLRCALEDVQTLLGER